MYRSWAGRLLAVLGLIISSTTFAGSARLPMTPARVGENPWGIAIDDATQRVFVSSWGPQDAQGYPTGRHGLITVLDASTGHVIASVSVGVRPSDLVVDPQGGRVFVAVGGGVDPLSGTDRNNGALTILDATSGAVGATIPLHTTPIHLVWDAALGHLFVFPLRDATAILFAARSNIVRTRTPLLDTPLGAAVDEHTHHLFVALYNVDGLLHGHGVVSMLDARTGALLRQIEVAGLPLFVTLDEGTHRIFVTNPTQDASAGGPSTISVLDAATGAVLRTLWLPIGFQPVVVNPATHRAFAPLPGRGELRVLDTTRGQSLGTVHVATGRTAIRPNWGGLTVDVRRNRLYLPFSGNGGGLLVLDGTSGRVLRSIARGIAASGVAINRRTGRLFVLDAGQHIVQMLDPP